jgi:hypothetical protein
MPVEDGIPEQDRAVDAADRQQREFAIEHHPAFEHRRLAADRRPGGGRVVDRADARLATAVIAEAGGLQHRGQADSGHGCVQVGLAMDRRPGGDGHAGRLEEGLFLQPVLAHGQRLAARAAGHQRRQDLQRTGGDVLELEGHGIDGGGEATRACSSS